MYRLEPRSIHVYIYGNPNNSGSSSIAIIVDHSDICRYPMLKIFDAEVMIYSEGFTQQRGMA